MVVASAVHLGARFLHGDVRLLNHIAQPGGLPDAITSSKFVS